MDRKILCHFYIIRHGQTDWNVKELIQGQEDVPLNSLGEKQAMEVAASLKNLHFDVAFSSDLLRAKRTTEIVALEHKLEVKTTKLLRERQLGNFVGKPTLLLNEIDETYKKLTEKEKEAYRKFHNLESPEDMVSRFITFLRETAIAHPGKTILVGTHAGMMSVLLPHLGYYTREELRVGGIKNGAYIKLASDGVDFSIEGTIGFLLQKRLD